MLIRLQGLVRSGRIVKKKMDHLGLPEGVAALGSHHWSFNTNSRFMTSNYHLRLTSNSQRLFSHPAMNPNKTIKALTRQRRKERKDTKKNTPNPGGGISLVITPYNFHLERFMAGIFYTAGEKPRSKRRCAAECFMNVCVPVAKRATRFEGVMRDDDQADKSEVNNQSVPSCREAAEKFQAINAAACDATSVDGLEILKSIFHFSRFDSHLPFFLHQLISCD